MSWHSQKLKSFVIVAVLLLSSVFILERLVSQQTWSLFQLRHHFLDGKNLVKMPLIGSMFHLTGRAAVAQGEIHLDRWYGLQEIRTAKPYELKELSLRSFLHEKGELTISWGNPGEIYEGLRITSTGASFFRTNLKGEWIHTKPLDLKLSDHVPGILTRLSALSRGALGPDRSVDLKFLFSEGVLTLFQDERKVTTIGPVNRNGYFSFQGNSFPVTIDELSLTGQNGEVIRENFEPDWSQKFFFIAIPITILLIIALSQFRYATTISYLFFLLVTVLFLADRHHFSNFELRHFAHSPDSFLEKAEQMRYRFFSGFLEAPFSMDLFRKSYPGPQNMNGNFLCHKSNPCTFERSLGFDEGKPKMLLLGTSQSAGAGADELENTFFVKLHRKLQSQMTDLSSLNISVSGATPTRLLNKFRKAVEEFGPDIILINLGHNGFPDDYKLAVEMMVRENKQRKIFLINEASTDQIEKKRGLSLFNEELSKKYPVRVVQLFQFFQNNDVHRANVWWDNVHFNNLGHDLAAQFIFEEISPHL